MNIDQQDWYAKHYVKGLSRYGKHLHKHPLTPLIKRKAKECDVTESRMRGFIRFHFGEFGISDAQSCDMVSPILSAFDGKDWAGLARDFQLASERRWPY